MRPWRVAATALYLVSAAVVLVTAHQLAQPPHYAQRVEAVAPATPAFSRHDSWPHFPATTEAPVVVTEASPASRPLLGDPEPTVPPAERPQSFSTDMGAMPAGCIRKYESGGTTDEGGDYGASGGGAYQIISSTWAGYDGYARAEDAPPSVQDAKAAELWAEAGRQHWAAQRGRCF